jgi:hypothetical protein
MEIPIACSLEASNARAQIGEWKDLLAKVMLRVDRVTPHRFEVVLRAELPEVRELVQLAQREKSCCPFFNFTLIIESSLATFVVEVPDDASSVLDDFIATIS